MFKYDRDSCEHGKLKTNCVVCSGCPHGKLKQNCAVNCTRFALKSFSIANVFPNMIDKKIQWVEFLQTGLLNNVIWKAALFEINFIDLAEDQIYLDAHQLTFHAIFCIFTLEKHMSVKIKTNRMSRSSVMCCSAQ